MGDSSFKTEAVISDRKPSKWYNTAKAAGTKKSGKKDPEYFPLLFLFPI